MDIMDFVLKSLLDLNEIIPTPSISNSYYEFPFSLQLISNYFSLNIVYYILSVYTGFNILLNWFIKNKFAFSF